MRFCGPPATCDQDHRSCFCGIDVSAKPATSSSCTLHERKGSEGVELVATFYAPGTVEEVARTIEGFGAARRSSAIDAPSGRRLDLLAPGAPARERARPAGRPLRAHARVRRRAVPPRPAALPGARPADEAAPELDDRRLRAVRGARAARPLRARRPTAPSRAGGRRRCARRGRSRPTPTRSSAPARPPAAPKRTPWGLQQRIARSSSRASSTTTAGSGTARSTRSTPAPPPTPPTRSSVGLGTWVGDPAEGVIVIPTSALLRATRSCPAPAAVRLGLIPAYNGGGCIAWQRRAQRGAASAGHCVQALATGRRDLRSELGEPLRTAGVASVGEIVQHRERRTRTSTSARARSRSSSRS